MVSHVGLDVCYKGFSIRYRDAIYLFGPVHKQYKQCSKFIMIVAGLPVLNVAHLVILWDELYLFISDYIWKCINYILIK